MKHLFQLFSLLMAFLLIGCDNDDNVNNIEVERQYDVYVTGQKDNKASYWKNGEINSLNTAGFENTIAKKIFTFENDVYIWGSTITGGIAGSTYFLWTNGRLTNLNETFEETEDEVHLLTDFYVHKGDLYFLGFMQNKMDPDIMELAYWKNGIKNTILTNCQTNFYAQLNVNEDDVYVLTTANSGKPGLFVNGRYKNTPSPYRPYHITTNSEGVYVLGRDGNNGSFYQNLKTDQLATFPYAIFNLAFDENDVYTVVRSKNGAGRMEIQKNHSPYYISQQGFETEVLDLKVIDKKLYVVLHERENNVGPSKLLINNEIGLQLDNPTGGDLLNSVFIASNR